MAKKYKRTFLKQVLVRVDFQNSLANYEKGLIPSVPKSISSAFPNFVEDKLNLLNIEVKKPIPYMIPEQRILWTYYAKDTKKHTRIEPTDFYIQYDEYDSFENLKSDLRLVLESLKKGYGELNITRIGLRYIDEIEIKGEDDIYDWKKYLNPKLYSAISLPTQKERRFISRAFSNLEFNYGNHNLILKYGMFNPDYPSPIKKKSFILDSDAYKRDNIPSEDSYDILDELHNRISNFFEKRLIKDGLRKIMNNGK